MLNVAILCTDPAHPVNAWLEEWRRAVADRARVGIYRDYRELTGGDLLFLVSCHQIVRKPTRDLFKHALVLHASDLPRGRGMSPHIWQIIEGKTEITLTLLEANDPLDSGDIWAQRRICFEGYELYDEINAKVFAAEVELMTWALDNWDRVEPMPQTGEPTYYRKRTPEDSRIDPQRPLIESFNLLRVADPVRYPAFFEIGGRKFKIRIERM
jgi:methionyl-tRNA formyltransferase